MGGAAVGVIMRDRPFGLAVQEDVHLASVQVDSAVELRGGSIILQVLTQ